MKNASIKETGKGGLTSLVRDFLKTIERLTLTYVERNHQTLGTSLGRSDFEVVIRQDVCEYNGEPIVFGHFIALEVKSPNWRGKLNRHQEAHKKRIERAGGEYHVITSIEQVRNILGKYSKKIRAIEFD